MPMKKDCTREADRKKIRVMHGQGYSDEQIAEALSLKAPAVALVTSGTRGVAAGWRRFQRSMSTASSRSRL